MIHLAIPSQRTTRKNAAPLQLIREPPMADPVSPPLPPVDEVFSRLYAQLKLLARSQRRRRGDTLNTTALVHDLYLSLAARSDLDLSDPARFYAYAAKAMRHLLIDRARARTRLKSGGDLIAVELPSDEQGLLDPLMAHPERAFELDSALSALAQEDARAAEVVELYLFGGLGIERIAELHGLSTRTVNRDWRFARAFLQKALLP